jgi:hypothetical protein
MIVVMIAVLGESFDVRSRIDERRPVYLVKSDSALNIVGTTSKRRPA